jgi:hypothetical protein
LEQASVKDGLFKGSWQLTPIPFTSQSDFEMLGFAVTLIMEILVEDLHEVGMDSACMFRFLNAIPANLLTSEW